MNIENFKQMMDLRENFASNRQKDKINVIDHQFSGSGNLADKKQGHRITTLKVVDTYREKDFHRKLKLISASRK